VSLLEETMAFQLKSAGIEFEREAQIIPGRKFAFDFSFPGRVLLEVQGGTFARGRTGHSSGMGIHRDIEKSNLATLAGYRLLACDEKHVTSGQALRWVQEALA